MRLQSHVSRLGEVPGDLATERAPLEPDLHEGNEDASRLREALPEVPNMTGRAGRHPSRSRATWVTAIAACLLLVWELLEVGFPDWAESLAKWLDILPLLGFILFLLGCFYFIDYYVRSRSGSQPPFHA